MSHLVTSDGAVILLANEEGHSRLKVFLGIILLLAWVRNISGECSNAVPECCLCRDIEYAYSEPK